MQAHQISSESIALILPAIEATDIRTTVESFLRDCGLETWDNIEAEVFPAGENCLLIARPLGPCRQRPAFRRKQRPKF